MEGIIKERFLAGEKMARIADDLGIPRTRVTDILIRAGLHTPKKVRSNFGKENAQKMLDMFANNMTCSEIGKILGCTTKLVTDVLKKYDIDTSKYSCHREDKLKNHTQEVLSLYADGQNIYQLARKFKAARSSITDILTANNISIRGPDLIPVNVDFFKVIDNEYNAYCLGLWYADGNTGIDKISLSMTDYSIVNKVKKVMSYEGQILTVDRSKYGWKTMYRLNICRGSMRDDMIRLGCVPNKSLVLTFPGPEIVSDRLLHHFIRGLFDGDGHIRHKCFKSGNLCIVGNDFFFEKFIERHPVEHYIIYKKKEHTPTVGFCVTRKNVMIDFLKWLYQDATIFLDRKYEIAKFYLEANGETITVAPPEKWIVADTIPQKVELLPV